MVVLPCAGTSIVFTRAGDGQPFWPGSGLFVSAPLQDSPVWQITFFMQTENIVGLWSCWLWRGRGAPVAQRPHLHLWSPDQLWASTEVVAKLTPPWYFLYELLLIPIFSTLCWFYCLPELKYKASYLSFQHFILFVWVCCSNLSRSFFFPLVSIPPFSILISHLNLCTLQSGVCAWSRLLLKLLL